MSILKILTDLCAVRQTREIKNTFENIIYNVLVMKKALQQHKIIA